MNFNKLFYMLAMLLPFYLMTFDALAMRPRHRHVHLGGDRIDLDRIEAERARIMKDHRDDKKKFDDVFQSLELDNDIASYRRHNALLSPLEIKGLAYDRLSKDAIYAATPAFKATAAALDRYNKDWIKIEHERENETKKKFLLSMMKHNLEKGFCSEAEAEAFAYRYIRNHFPRQIKPELHAIAECIDIIRKQHATVVGPAGRISWWQNYTKKIVCGSVLAIGGITAWWYYKK